MQFRNGFWSCNACQLLCRQLDSSDCAHGQGDAVKAAANSYIRNPGASCAAAGVLFITEPHNNAVLGPDHHSVNRRA